MSASLFRRASACLVLLVLTMAAAGGAATGSLPGGTSIEVTVGSPADGSTLPQQPVTVTGTASVGTATPVANTTLIYIVDVSGSTSSVTSAGCPAQTVYRNVAGTTLDCELLAVRDMNQAAISEGTVAEVGLIGFGGTPSGTTSGGYKGLATDGQALDLAPAAGAQPLVAPDANTFGGTIFHLDTPTTDLDWVLQSAYSDYWTIVPGWPTPQPHVGFTQFTPWANYGDTNYWAAINALNGLLPGITTPKILAVFLSDGDSNTGGPNGEHVGAALSSLSKPVTIDTFAIGASASCNPGVANMGTLQEIATTTGGTCQHITDPADAAGAVPAAIASKLASISLSLDGGTPVAPDTVSSSLPATGPVAVTFSKAFTPAPGAHEVCATATGSDGGGSDSIQDCTTFTVKAAPTVTVGDGSGNAGTTDEGTPFPLAASASSDPLTWSASGGEGTCTFADPHSANTDVTCNDEGTYTLTLTADDGVNTPVTSTETLTVENVAPSLTITAPADGAATGYAVTLTASISDPGIGALTCTVDWGDGSTPVTVSPSGGVCTANHTYGVSGPETITVTGADDDGGTVQRSVAVTVDPVGVLLSLTANLPPGKSLPSKAANIKADIDAGNTTAACNLLAAFVSEVQAQSGKQLTVSQANDLLAAAAQVESFLGC